MRDMKRVLGAAESKTPRLRVVSLLLAGALASTLAGCDGSHGSPAGPSAGPADPVTTVLASRTVRDLAPGSETVFALAVPRAGTLGVSVTWTDTSNTIQVSLASSSCEQRSAPFGPVPDTCRVRPGRVSNAARDRAEYEYDGLYGDYQVTVRNVGPGMESVTFNATLTYQGDSPARDPGRQPGRGRPEEGRPRI